MRRSPSLRPERNGNHEITQLEPPQTLEYNSHEQVEPLTPPSSAEEEQPLLLAPVHPPGNGLAEGKRILAIGLPLVAENCVSYAASLVAMGMVGRLGAAALGAYSLAHSVTNITGVALLNGVTGALDTFGSQAHGSRAFPAIGLVLQRALIASLATSAPLMVLFAFSRPLLRALGQQPSLAAVAGRYIRLFAPTIPLHGINLCMYRTLASQAATLHVLAASTAFFAATALIHWLLIFRLSWSLDGSALAYVACEAIYAASLATACMLHNTQRPPEERWWAGWSREALLSGWGPFLKLSLAAAAMIVADWWLYDILTLLAGLLPSPDVPLAATGVIYNINTTIFMVPYGLAYALCARVGQLLGAGRPRAAKLAAQVGTALGLAIVALIALLLLLFSRQVPAIFTSDPAVIQACASLMLPLAALLLTNGATGLQSGILHGTGRQMHGAVVNGAANYAVGLPLMLLLAFRLGYGVQGLWWGILAASALQGGILLLLVGRFDWRAEAERAARLVRHLSQVDELYSAAEKEPGLSEADCQPILQPPAEVAPPLVRGV